MNPVNTFKMSKGIQKCQSFDIVRFEGGGAQWLHAAMVLATFVYAVAIPRAALSSSYSPWLHWRSSAVSTALRHRFRNTSAPS